MGRIDWTADDKARRLDHLRLQTIIDKAACDILDARIAGTYKEALAMVREVRKQTGRPI